MAGKFEGKVAIVTGGGRGIGRAIAQGFAAEGAAVTVTARTASQLEETVASIEAAGGRALAVSADVSEPSAAEQVLAETEAQFGPVDVLVNNAGVNGPSGPLWEVDAGEWRKTMDVNLIGPFLFARAVLPGMVQRRQGRIINVSSGAGNVGLPMQSAYSTSKAALTRMTEILAAETAPSGIQVFAIGPGAVRTQLLEEFIDARKKADLGLNEVWDNLWEIDTPPERAASLCVLLASGAADGLSGMSVGARDNIADLAARADELNERQLYKLRLAVE